MMDKISILLVEDHLLVREGIRKSLARIKNFNVVGEAVDGEEAIKKAGQLKPDVILMDISLPKMSGIEATRRIKKLHPATIVLILTAYDYDQYIFHVLEAGAAGYLLKDLSSAELIRSIQTVCRGESVLHPAVANKVLARFRNNKSRHDEKELLPLLTEREIQILKMTARAMSNHDIAEKLQLSVRTVESHLSAIFNKMGVGSRTEAVLQAILKGLFTIEELS